MRRQPGGPEPTNGSRRRKRRRRVKMAASMGLLSQCRQLVSGFLWRGGCAAMPARGLRQGKCRSFVLLLCSGKAQSLATQAGRLATRTSRRGGSAMLKRNEAIDGRRVVVCFCASTFELNRLGLRTLSRDGLGS